MVDPGWNVRGAPALFLLESKLFLGPFQVGIRTVIAVTARIGAVC